MIGAKRSRFVTAGGVRTHYVQAGEAGPAVILCHGAGRGTSGEFGYRRLIPLLADRFRLYIPDSVGGFGETDPTAPITGGVLARLRHLESFIETLDLRDVIVGGNSQGAWVAARYAIDHADRVRALLLIASATIANAMGLSAPDSEGMRAVRENDGSREAMRRQLESVIHDRALVTDALIDERVAAARRPGVAEAAKAFQQENARYTKDATARPPYDLRADLPGLALPAAFVWGEEDRFAPVALGRQLEPLLPRVPFAYVPAAGHQVQTDRPEIVAEIVRSLEERAMP
jgi:2-hydroxy-6-oxonona-2,4-dienedioate hydrolase